MLGNGEEIFYIVPGLQQHAQYPVGLAAGRGGHAFGHLFLNHAAATGYAVFIVENLEKYLARYVVGIVADDAEGAFVELGQVELEKVFGDNTVAQLGKVLLQVFDRLGVELDHREVVAFVQQKPGEDSHAGPHLEHGHAFIAGQGVGNRLGYAQVGEKMLSQRFLGFDHVAHEGSGFSCESIKYLQRRFFRLPFATKLEINLYLCSIQRYNKFLKREN